jgi:hypothetical protein
MVTLSILQLSLSVQFLRVCGRAVQFSAVQLYLYLKYVLYWWSNHQVYLFSVMLSWKATMNEYMGIIFQHLFHRIWKKTSLHCALLQKLADSPLQHNYSWFLAPLIPPNMSIPRPLLSLEMGPPLHFRKCMCIYNFRTNPSFQMSVGQCKINALKLIRSKVYVSAEIVIEIANTSSETKCVLT